MAVIGKLTRNAAGDLEGSFRTLTLGATISLGKNPNHQPDKPDSPELSVYAVTRDGELIQIGNAWRKTVTDPRGPGRDYLSLSMDDPSWPGPLSCAAFPARESGEWDLIWNRPQRQAA